MKTMSNLSEFEQHFYKSFAEKFVELYVDFSKSEAALYAVEHVRKDNMALAKPFVDEEFIKRGYEF